MQKPRSDYRSGASTGRYAGATARERRMVSTYSTSEISTFFVDSRLRASQLTTGTSLEIASASRTSCALWYCMPSKQLIATRYGRRRCSKKSMAAKQSASRRVSTMTTAPIAPRTSSSHMNQKRVWPGVPNRYKMRSRSMLMRPKSIATVVVVLPGTCRLSSTPTPAEVMIASVVSGGISETDPTSVVFPTPNPPAMTIFADVTRPPVGRRDMSEPAKSTQHPLQQFRAHRIGFVFQRCRLVDGHQAVRRHVGDDDPSHAERQLHACGDLGQRLNPAAVTHRRYVLMLATLTDPGVVRGTATYGCLNERFQRYFQFRPGPAPGHGVRSDQSAGRLVAFGHRHRSPHPSDRPRNIFSFLSMPWTVADKIGRLPVQPRTPAVERAAGVSAPPTRSTSSAIS